MTTTQLSILRTIATHQPILKDDLYHPLPVNNYELESLRKRGYINYSRARGPVWLTIRGLDAIKGVIHEEIQIC